jgi:flavorubredoxin
MGVTPGATAHYVPGMRTRIDEVAPAVYRISTFVPDAGPDGFTFNQFLLRGEQPLLFHTGPRGIFPAVSAAFAKVVPVSSLRWIHFGHVESDECGSMNEWLAAAPRAQVCHGATAVMVSLTDLCDRPPRTLADGEVIDIGGLRVRHLDTPHVPHAWESSLVYEESTRTLLAGDLFTRAGDMPPSTEGDIVEPARVLEEAMRPSCYTPRTGPTIRRLADLQPRFLATMHGSTFRGDGKVPLTELAALYDGWLASDAAGN